MRIRFATSQDIPAILALGEVMVAASRFRAHGLNREKTAKVLEAMVGQPAHATILLATNSAGEVVGMLAGYISDFFFCDVLVAQDRFFFVRPEARGSSAAMKLLQA